MTDYSSFRAKKVLLATTATIILLLAFIVATRRSDEPLPAAPRARVDPPVAVSVPATSAAASTASSPATVPPLAPRRSDARCFQRDSLPANAPSYPAIPARFVLDESKKHNILRSVDGARLDSASWTRDEEAFVIAWRPQVIMRLPAAGGNATLSWDDAVMMVNVKPCS